MKKLTPVNGHLLIEPVKHEEFVVTDRAVYEEIGIVIDAGDFIQAGKKIRPGDRVYFDSWLAARFPGEKPDTFLWLVKWEDVRAVEYAE